MTLIFCPIFYCEFIVSGYISCIFCCNLPYSFLVLQNMRSCITVWNNCNINITVPNLSFPIPMGLLLPGLFVFLWFFSQLCSKLGDSLSQNIIKWTQCRPQLQVSQRTSSVKNQSTTTLKYLTNTTVKNKQPKYIALDNQGMSIDAKIKILFTFQANPSNSPCKTGLISTATWYYNKKLLTNKNL